MLPAACSGSLPEMCVTGCVLPLLFRPCPLHACWLHWQPRQSGAHHRQGAGAGAVAEHAWPAGQHRALPVCLAGLPADDEDNTVHSDDCILLWRRSKGKTSSRRHSAEREQCLLNSLARRHTAPQDDQGVYRFVCDDPKGATFRNLALQPPCMLWCGLTPAPHAATCGAAAGAPWAATACVPA